MREVGDESYVEPLSIKTDMESEFEFGDGQPDVIKEVLNHAYEAISSVPLLEGGKFATPEDAAIHLANDVWMLKGQVERLRRKFEKVSSWNRERRSTLDGLTEHESDVGMVRLASTICPSLEDIKKFADEQTTEHPDGMSRGQCADLYGHRTEILELLLQALQEEDWAARFREACLIVLEDCAFERVEAEKRREAQASVDEILEHGHLLSDKERQQINLKVLDRPEIEDDEVVVIEKASPEVSRETQEEGETDG